MARCAVDLSKYIVFAFAFLCLVSKNCGINYIKINRCSVFFLQLCNANDVC